MTTTVLVLTGFVVFYGPAHDMPTIAARQGVEIPAGYYGIAALHEEWLGWTRTLTIDGQEWLVVAVDYAHPDDAPEIQRRNIIAEVGWAHAGEIPHLRRNGRLFGRLWLQAPGEVTECPQPLWCVSRWCWPSSPGCSCWRGCGIGVGATPTYTARARRNRDD